MRRRLTMTCIVVAVSFELHVRVPRTGSVDSEESHLRKLCTCMSPFLIVKALRGIFAVRRLWGRERSHQEIKVSTPQRRSVQVHVSARRPLPSVVVPAFCQRARVS